MNPDKIVLTAIGGTFALCLSVIAYFVVKTYDKVDSMYDFTITHPIEHRTAMETIKRENNSLWEELVKINEYLANRDSQYYYTPKYRK